MILGKIVFFGKAESLAFSFLKFATRWLSLFSGQNAKIGPDEARSHVGRWNLVQRHIFVMREEWGGLFLDCAIYRGRLFSGRNAKMGPDRARGNVGGWNLVQRHIFLMREEWGGLFLDCAIYMGSLFGGWNAKMGPDRARGHVGGWNLVQRRIFFNVWRLRWFIFGRHHLQGYLVLVWFVAEIQKQNRSRWSQETCRRLRYVWIRSAMPVIAMHWPSGIWDLAFLYFQLKLL